MNHQAAVFKELQRRGFDPSEPETIPQSEYDKVRMVVRTRAERVHDGAKLVVAKVGHALGMGDVPEAVSLGNITQCRKNECGSYGTLENGDEVCHRCNCHGKDLFLKVGRKKEFCPATPPYWDNRTLLTINQT